MKWSETSQGWHPHLHCLLRSEFLNQAELSTHWHTATGDSYIVDVRLVRDHDQAAEYVTKYVTKPCNQTTYANHDRLCEMIAALTGRHLILPFGSFKMPKLEPTTDDTEWIRVAPLADILWRASLGVDEDVQLVALLTRRTACGTNQTTNPRGP